MADKIDYERPATVILLGGNTPNWKDTLTAAIRRVMAMSPEEQSQVAIMTDNDAVPGATMPLRYQDIAQLHQRPDFPR